MKNITVRKAIKRRKNLNSNKQPKIEKPKKTKKLKTKIILNIKKRSKNKNILNEISQDIEKIKLEPENLILIKYIDKKISNP